VLDGKQFDSRAEGSYYLSLSEDLFFKRIKAFECQPMIDLDVCKYIPDFKITRLDGSVFYVDIKSSPTREKQAYRLKLKMMYQKYPDIEFVEIFDRVVNPAPLKRLTKVRIVKLIEDELFNPIINNRE